MTHHQNNTWMRIVMITTYIMIKMVCQQIMNNIRPIQMRWIESNRIKKDIKDKSPSIITNPMLITSATTIDSFRTLMMKTMRILLITLRYQKMTLQCNMIIVVKVVGLILFQIKEKLKVITLNLNPLEEVEQKVL